jgi:flagellin-like hook-associated protein FlgL
VISDSFRFALQEEDTMSDVVLSASVRQNLLSLQSTANLLATTQERLATGKKVNTALDNPTNFFTAQALDNRASDISNLLDGINNGVQVLQAANTGITSLQKLIDSAKSIANQALQTTVGYSTKSNVQTTIPGATPADLRGTTSFASATASSNVLYTGAAGGTTAAGSGATLGAPQGVFTGSAATAGDGTTALAGGITLIANGGATATGLVGNAQPADGDTITVNGHTVTFRLGAAPTSSGVPAGSGVSGNIVTDGNGNSTVYLGSTTTPTGTVSDLLTAIDLASGVKSASISAGAATITQSGATVGTAQTVSSIAGGKVTLESPTGADLGVTGKADFLKALGLTTATGAGNATVTATRATAGSSLGSSIQDGSTLNVDGHVITFKNAQTPQSTAAVPTGYGVSGNVVTDGNGNSTVYLQSGTVADVLKAIDLATGVQSANIFNGAATVTAASGQTPSSVSPSGQLKISTGVNADLAISATGNALNVLGLAGNTGTASAFTAARTSGVGGISGKTLSITSFNGGTPVSVTFGDGTNGTVKTLDQLNQALQADNLSATIDANGVLTIATTNDYASSTIGSALSGGVLGGTLTSALTFTTAQPPVQDAVAQAARGNLVSQYNNSLAQIDTTSQDSSFNGINLLNGDTLKLVFNETGRSTLSINGVTFNSAGLGLSNLVTGVDFIDNGATNRVLASLNAASSTLRSEGSSLGSNLSIVEIRQDFSKNLINVLQTGSSNLTLADTNEEAANSQALSTRQSIAVSALALANQSQQSVLQLLR